jgi:hypothetical protein
MSDIKRLLYIEAREIVKKVLISVNKDSRLRDVTQVIRKTNPEDNERFV